MFKFTFTLICLLTPILASSMNTLDMLNNITNQIDQIKQQHIMELNVCELKCGTATPDPSATGTATPDPSATGTATTKFFRYAEIPDIVFVESYADSENMGIYMLNPNNLYPVGELNNTWKPKLLSQIKGILPTGVTFDANTGKLVYDGSSIAADIETQIRLYQPDTNQESIVFNVKVLKVDVVYDGSMLLHQALARLPSTGNGVLLIKRGQYDKTQINCRTNNTGNKVCDGYLPKIQGKDKIYIIGEPGDKPKLNVPDINGKRTNLVILTKNNNYLYYKNLDIAKPKLNSAKYTVFNNMFIHDQWGTDVITQSNNAGQLGDTLFISNMEMTRCGSDGVYHCIYLHGNSRSESGEYLRKAFINNIKTYQMVGGGKNYGGIAIKSLTEITKIRNFWVSQSKDPRFPDVGPTARSQPINIAEFTKTVIFNGKIFSNIFPILFSNRNMASAGNINPSYYTSATQRYPLYENVITKGKTFHGENANFLYTKTGTLGDLTPSARQPVNAPFWDRVGNVADPYNDKLTLHKYISYVEFNTENKIGANRKHTVGIDLRGTAPTATVRKFASVFDRLPAPPNWVERSYLFAGNNIFNGYKLYATQKPYQLDFKETYRYIYPYAPDPYKPRQMNNIGGDVFDNNGKHTAFPEWFKI